MEILAEQAEFPELISNVLANVRDRAVGANDDFRVVIIVRGWLCSFIFRGQMHDPAARVFSGGGFVNRAALDQFLKRRIPEFQMEDFAFARKKIVFDPEAIHGAEVTVHNRGGYDFRDLGGSARATLNGFEHFAAKFEARLVLFKKLR